MISYDETKLSYQDVIVGDTITKIPTYKSLMILEKGEPLSPFQYLSCLFNNLGYDHCPSNMNWIKKGVSIDQVKRTEVIDYPITYLPLMIRKKSARLDDLLDTIKLWCKSTAKKGHLLNVKHSYRYPEEQELAYLYSNKLLYKFCASTDIKLTYWDGADIITERYHNLNPNINKVYFENSIRNFEGYAKYFRIENPCGAFALALVNPDILMTIIRQSEIEAAKRVSKYFQDNNIFQVYRNDYDMVYEFQSILNQKINFISNIFENFGFQGLCNLNRVFLQYNAESNNITHSVRYIDEVGVYRYPNGDIDRFSNLSIEDKPRYVNEFIFDAELRDSVLKYLNVEKLPDELTNMIVHQDGTKEPSALYVQTFKRLHVVFIQLENYKPEVMLMNIDNKFVLAQSFFIDPNRFALYDVNRNKCVVVTADYNIYDLTVKDAVDYYKNNYNIDVYLTNSEIDIESPETPDYDVMSFTTIPPSPVIIESPPIIDYIQEEEIEYNTQEVIEQEINQSNSYGFDLSRIVKGWDDGETSTASGNIIYN